jgi:hypothetical protein
MSRQRVLDVCAAAVLGFSLLAANAAEAAKAKFKARQLVGGWQLVTAGNPNPSIRAFGAGDGYAVFQPNGRFALTLVVADLPKFTSNNRAMGTAEENKAVVQGSIAYFGTYALDGSELTLHVERCTYPNWNGTDLKRPIVSLTADELKYDNPAASVGGTTQLVWKRVR